MADALSDDGSAPEIIGHYFRRWLYVYEGDDYPSQWHSGLIQYFVRRMANFRCEECSMEFDVESNLAVFARNRDGKPTVGTVHHINGEKNDCRPENLVYLCQRCHLKIQWEWTPGDVLPLRFHGAPPAWMTARGYDPPAHPQMRLF